MPTERNCPVTQRNCRQFPCASATSSYRGELNRTRFVGGLCLLKTRFHDTTENSISRHWGGQASEMKRGGLRSDTACLIELLRRFVDAQNLDEGDRCEFGLACRCGSVKVRWVRPPGVRIGDGGRRAAGLPRRNGRWAERPGGAL